MSTKSKPDQKEGESEGAKANMTLCTKAKFILTHITVEPMLLMYILPSAMSMIATQNLNLEKACRVNLQMDENICDAMASRNQTGYNETDEVVVQKLVASMNAWKNGIQSLVPSILLLFIGSWSDRHKRRKPCILIPIFGEVVSCIGLLIATYYFYELPIEFVVFIEAVPPSVLGGWASSFAAIFSYISNISSVETRTLRIGAVNLFLNVSWTIGVSFSGILYRNIGFYGVFSVALIMYVGCITYGYLRVQEIPGGGGDGEDKKEISAEEPKGVDGKDLGKLNEKKVGFLRDFFNWKHIRDTFRVAFKKEGRNRRARICTIMILAIIIIGPLHGEWNILYLFTRYKFGWNGVDFSTYTAFTVILHALGTLFSLTFFSKFLQLDDAILGLISSSSKICACFVYAFAPNSLIFYAGALVEILNGTSFIAMRSIMSKLVSPDELGKIYSLFGVSEAIVPLIYGPLYSIVYRYTINVMPGAFFLVGGALTSPAILIFLWLYFENKKDRKEKSNMAAQEEALLKKDENNQETTTENTIKDGGQSSDSISFLPRPTASKSKNALSAVEDGKNSAQKPPSVVCYICGRLFGTHSINIHEAQCLKKWRAQNNLLPPHKRKPTPKKIDTGQMTSRKDSSCQVIFEQKENERKESSATNTKRPPMFPCYLCGREFSVNSIYIHEPQCLKKWRIENEKLPPEKRRPEPTKPDIKFTPSGEVDYVGTFHRIWENHLAELIPCKTCGRKFFPDRIEKHEQACNGLGIKLKNKK